MLSINISVCHSCQDFVKSLRFCKWAEETLVGLQLFRYCPFFSDFVIQLFLVCLLKIGVNVGLVLARQAFCSSAVCSCAKWQVIVPWATLAHEPAECVAFRAHTKKSKQAENLSAYIRIMQSLLLCSLLFLSGILL